MTHSLVKSSYYPALADSSSWHKTGFQNPAEFQAEAPSTADDEYRRKEEAGNAGKSRFELKAVYSSVQRASAAERLGNRRFKMFSFRPGSGAPPSTGTSQIQYPCLTSGLAHCLTLSIAAISNDGRTAKGRNFHCHVQNDTWETLSQYSAYLDAYGLTRKIATLSGGWGNKHKNTSLTAETEQDLGKREVNKRIKQSVENANRIKAELLHLGINLIVDHAGNNRPADMTEDSNVGFEFLRKPDSTIEFRYMPDLILSL